MNRLKRDENMQKHAWLPKLLRALETPIPGTPKLVMPVKDQAQLDASEAARREWIRENVHGGLERGLKGIKVDKLYQKLEPVLGNTSETPERRATYGERRVHQLAHQPVKELVSALPIPYGVGATAYQGTRDFIGGRLGIPKAPSYEERNPDWMVKARASISAAPPQASQSTPPVTAQSMKPVVTPQPLHAEPSFLKASPKVAAAYAEGRKAALEKFALLLV